MSEHEHQHDNCHDLLAAVGEYVDGSLRADLCTELEKHLAGCSRCRIVVDTTRKTIQLIHDSAEEVQLPAEVRQRLFACLDLQEYLDRP